MIVVVIPLQRQAQSFSSSCCGEVGKTKFLPRVCVVSVKLVRRQQPEDKNVSTGQQLGTLPRLCREVNDQSCHIISRCGHYQLIRCVRADAVVVGHRIPLWGVRKALCGIFVTSKFPIEGFAENLKFARLPVMMAYCQSVLSHPHPLLFLLRYCR